MVLRLFGVMNVPLLDQNQALLAAGFEARFPVFSAETLAPEVEQALLQMMTQHEPFPLVVLLIDGTILMRNQGAANLFSRFVASPEAVSTPANMFSLLFDPQFMRPFVVDWDSLARSIVSRLHREHLHRGDARVDAAIERVLAQPGVPREWRQPDFSANIPPTLQLWLQLGDLRVRFLVTVTAFSTPRPGTLDDLRIECCFPIDDETRQACVRLGTRS